MLRLSVGFFVFGLFAIVLGAYNIGGLSIELGKIILGVFLLLAVLSFLVSVITGKKQNIIT